MIVIITAYILSKRFFLKRKGLSGPRVQSEYGFAIHLNSISDEWLNAICWSSCLFGIFILKWFVEFSLIFFDTAKLDCAIKTREMFSFLLLINTSFTIGLYSSK